MTSLRREIYHSWLDAERDALYWECLSSRAEVVDGRFSLASGILSSAAVLSLVTGFVADFGLPIYVKGLVTGGCAILSAGLSFYARQQGYAKKSAKYAMLQGMHMQQARTWKRLRDRVLAGEGMSDDLLHELRVRQDTLLAHETGHKQDDKVALQCERQVREMERLFRDSYSKRLGVEKGGRQ